MEDPESVVLRGVSMADAELLLAWRNDSLSRSASRQPGVISLDEHRAWLNNVLRSSEHIIRIAEKDGVAVGVVRAARRKDRWELSWTVAPDARGRGLGGKMLRSFVAGLHGQLAAEIRKTNIASARIAAAAGLHLQGSATDSAYDLWIRE